MLNNELTILILSSASIGFFHTLLGPDHYLPFVVMQKAKNWSLQKTLWLTFLCGLGHISSSIILGIIGIAFGKGLYKLQLIESVRGELAAWMLITFGLVYLIFGIHKTIKNKPHTHAHIHTDGDTHSHIHTHTEEHTHIHEKKDRNLTTWALFIIFIFGPSGALIPLLIYPIINKNIFSLILIVGIFSITKIITMLLAVIISSLSINLLPTKKLERYFHALAGSAILLSGITIKFLGL